MWFPYNRSHSHDDYYYYAVVSLLQVHTHGFYQWSGTEENPVTRALLLYVQHYAPSSSSGVGITYNVIRIGIPAV